MEQQNKEYHDAIYIYDLWKVMVKRRRIIIGLFLIIIISTAIVSLFIPKSYRGDVKLNVVDNSALSTIDISFRNILIAKGTLDAKEIIDSMGSIDDAKKKLIMPKTYISVKSVKLMVLSDTKKIVAIVNANSADDIPVAMSELVDFLNNMESVKASLKEERELLMQRSIELTSIIKSASDLLAAYNKLILEGKITNIGYNPIDLSKRIADIKNEKLVAEQALSRLKNGRIQIITPPYISNKPVSPKILQNVYVAGILGLFFGIALAFLMEYVEKIKNIRSFKRNG